MMYSRSRSLDAQIEGLRYAEKWFSCYGVTYEDFDGTAGCMAKPKIHLTSKLREGSVAVTGTLDFANDARQLDTACNHPIPELLSEALGQVVANNFEKLCAEALDLMKARIQSDGQHQRRELDAKLRAI